MKNPLIAILFCLGLAEHSSGKTIPDHARADLVLGQTDFTSGTFVLPFSSSNASSPTAITIDPVSRKVFVAEYGGNRILRYPNADALTNGAAAEAVFGQASFSDGGEGTGELRMDDPLGLFFDRHGRLWVADTSHHRILMYETASYRNTQPQPDRVYGQPDFTTTVPGTTAATMRFPQGVFVDSDDRLWVADTNNSRVLRFDAISNKPSGAAADGVLGQSSFTLGGFNGGAAGLNAPTGITVSRSGALFVACRNDNRVLRFDHAAELANGANANGVLGQPNFTSDTDGSGARHMDDPVGVWLTRQDSLWVCDSDNNRVLRFDHASTRPNGAAADGVVGQPDFTTESAKLTRRGLSLPGNQPFVDTTGSLWVPDRDHNRVLRFPPDVTKPQIAITSTVPQNTTSRKLLLTGTASDAYGITKVQYRIGDGKVKSADGTTSWRFTASLAKGKNRISIFSTDSVGNVSLTKVFTIKRN